MNISVYAYKYMGTALCLNMEVLIGSYLKSKGFLPWAFFETFVVWQLVLLQYDCGILYYVF